MTGVPRMYTPENVHAKRSRIEEQQESGKLEIHHEQHTTTPLSSIVIGAYHSVTSLADSYNVKAAPCASDRFTFEPTIYKTKKTHLGCSAETVS